MPPANIIWAMVLPLPSSFLLQTPEFTDQARRKKLQGVVVVALTVNTAGNPEDVRVARSMAEDVSQKDKQIAVELDEKAVEAVKQYKFQAGQFQESRCRWK